MESTSNHYYSITKRMLSLAGQWPYQERRTRLFLVSFVTATTVSMIVPMIFKLIQCDGNLRCSMLTVPSIMLMLMFLVKLYTCQFNSSKIKALIDRLDSDWEKLEGADEQDITKTYAANARLLSLAYCLYYYIVAGAFVSISLIPHVLNAILPLNESRPIFMPYEAYYFVDGEKYFFYIFFHAIVCVEIGITAVVAHDCMLLICIQHICSVFAVAGFRFGILSRTDRNDAINNDVYNQKFAVSVYAHWRALQFAQLLEKTFCASFAIQIMIVTVAMSISLLQLNEIPEMMRYTAFVISQVIHLFCISLQGQRLIDHSVKIRDQIYNSSWYEIPAKWQKLLLYVMRKSMQPNYLSAGKIYVFSLKSFTTNALIFKVIQSSVSYFTVLASFQ
ncbi:uncharacterized protein [Temnothorax longispinosus]|uniref:uncharacterized protein isoform X2 n=1 Tax=Temnothorax longispinosus TaxID=300112 RepID=UPI003A9A5DCC